MALQQSTRGAQYALSLARIDARRRAAPLVSLAMTHFDDQHYIRMQRDEVEFTTASAKISQQYRRAL